MRYLEALQDVANDACKLAFEHRANFPDEAVNWADFHCVEARVWRSSEGTSGYSVYLEEASPSPGNDLMQFIQDHLKKNGFEDVEVILDW